MDYFILLVHPQFFEQPKGFSSGKHEGHCSGLLIPGRVDPILEAVLVYCGPQL